MPDTVDLVTKPFVLSLSKDFPHFRQPFDKLWANGLFLNIAMNQVGEPDAGNPHVRFDERRLETEPSPPRQSSTLLNLKPIEFFKMTPKKSKTQISFSDCASKNREAFVGLRVSRCIFDAIDELYRQPGFSFV